MRISHIDIKLTDGSNCVMKMDELPQNIQLNLKDAIFSWLLFSKSTRVVTDQDILAIMKEEHRLSRERKQAVEQNTLEIESTKPMLGKGSLLKSPWTGLPIDKDSSRAAVQTGTASFLLKMGNKPQSAGEIARFIKENRLARIAITTISTYIYELARTNILDREVFVDDKGYKLTKFKLSEDFLQGCDGKPVAMKLIP